jgi:hypothetical protein
MKRASFIIAFSVSVCQLFAQISLDVKTIDLSGNGKNKRSKLVTANFNPATKDVTLMFNVTECEVEKEGSYFAGYTGLNFKGLKYNLQSLTFSEDGQFKNSSQESIVGLDNALQKAPVLGKNFEIKEPYGYVVGAGREGVWLNQFEYFVKLYAPSVVNSVYEGYCTQKIEARKTDVKLSFTGEGMLGFKPLPDGVITLTYTGSKGFVRSFDNSGVKRIEKQIDLGEYGFAANVVPFETEVGGVDILVVLQPTEKYNKYGIKIDKAKANPLEFEFIRIDGHSLEVKDRFTFNALNTQWNVERVYESKGSLYVMGQTASKVELSPYLFGPFITIEGSSFQKWIRIDELENYQVMKITNGKMDYISVITPAEMEKVQSAIPGTKGGNAPSGYFRQQEIKFLNNKMYITGQFTKPGADGDERKAEFLMILNESGKPDKLFYAPKKNYAHSDMSLSADGKTMLWSIYDYSAYDIRATRLEPTQIKLGWVTGGQDHTFRVRKNDDGPQLELVKIDLTNNTPSALQICGENEYTVFDETPLLYNSGTEVVFLGVSGGKKERVSKIIRAKF